MAKQQTFVDKSRKKGVAAEHIAVKVVVVNRSDRGTYTFSQKLIKVKDLSEVEQQVGRA